MHVSQREKQILDMVAAQGFVSFQEFDAALQMSAATLRRDLERLDRSGKIKRIRGGAESIDRSQNVPDQLLGAPFHENASLNESDKRAIGRAAASLCKPGEAVMIDGGSTTLQICPHLANLNLQVLTNSLHVVNALLRQVNTRVLVPAGTVFREQNIILSAAGEDGLPRFHAPKLFMGASSLGPQGLMQTDIILVAAERRLIDRADTLIVLADSSKFTGPSGNVVCELSDIDVIVTDSGISDEHRALIEATGIDLVVAPCAD